MDFRRNLYRLARAACLILAAASAMAQTCEVRVNGTGPYPSLEAAVNALPDLYDNRLTISGVCKGKTSIHRQVNLTIEGMPGARLEPPDGSSEAQPQTLNLHVCDEVRIRDLTIKGMPGVHGAFTIWDSRRVEVDATTFEDAGQHAVWIPSSTAVFLRNVTIQNNSGGIRVDGQSSAVLEGAWVPGTTGTSLLQNNGVGAQINRSALLSLRGDTVVRNNGVGIGATNGHLSVCCFEDIHYPRIESNTNLGINMRGGYLNVEAPLTVQNNGRFGMILTGTNGRIQESVIRDQGSPGSTSGGGILLIGGVLEIGGSEITGNHGAGVTVIDGGTARLFNTEVTGNAGDGIRLEGLSMARILTGTVVRDNGDTDLRCSKSSVALSTSDAIGTMKCAAFNKD